MILKIIQDTVNSFAQIFESRPEMLGLHAGDLGTESLTPLPENSSEENPSPGPASPQFSKSHDDIPIELWYSIFKLLAPPDTTRPTHHTLVKVRGVCHLWRNIAEELIWKALKLLVASPRLFDPSDEFPRDRFPHDIRLWLEESFSRLVEGNSWVSNTSVRAERVREQDIHSRHGAGTGTELQLVSFHLDERYRPDQNLARFFVFALSKCERADITIDHFPASITPFPSSDAKEVTSVAVPVIPLRQFSFSSMNFGIRDTLPPQFNFLWNSLRQGLPWSQLTDITLDCVLSYDDALFVLSATVNVKKVELGRLSSTSLLRDDMTNIVSTVHTLKINTNIDLRLLFSRLDLPVLEDLQLAVYLDSMSNISQNHILDPGLPVPWQVLKRLSLQSDLTYRQCDLDRILQQCHQLEQLEWKGDCSEFNHLPHNALKQLQELRFASDWAGHSRLRENIQFLSNITRLSLSWYHPLLTEDEHLSNLLHIAISGPITIVQLFLILRSRTKCLLSGEFRLNTITEPLPSLVSSDTLQFLRLTLPVAGALAFPWGALHAPELRALEMEIDGVSSLIGCKMEAFRSMHPNTIISILP